MTDKINTENIEKSKTRLLEICPSCGKKSGTLASTKLTGWLFNKNRCGCLKSNDSSETVNHATTIGDNTKLLNETVEKPQMKEDFTIEELIGRGGMGDVFKGVNTKTDSTVAIKTLTRELADDREAVKRFANEVDTILKLDHPNIVSVLGKTETEDGRPCLVMDFVEGENLSRHLKSGGKLNEKEAIELFVQIGEALQYAHESGVIHRDLKPTNVMIQNPDSKQPGVKLLDFGIAKVMPTTSGDRDTQDLTKTGEIFGSPAYMSPEQCMGFKLDERSDIYSFGCLMYETLTGRPPFQAENPIQIVVSHLSNHPEPWSGAKAGKVLEGLEALVFKCLEKEQVDRYQNISDLLKDLKNLQDGKKISVGTRVAEKATLSAGQGILILGEILLLSIYWLISSAALLDIITFIPVILLPLTSFLLIRHLKKYGSKGSGWKQWRLLSLIMYTLIGITAIPVSIGFLGISESFPLAFQYLYAVSFVLNCIFICLASATRLGAFMFSGSLQNFKKVSLQFFLIAIPLLILPFSNFPFFSSYLVPSISSKLLSRYQWTSLRPKQSRVMAETAKFISPKSGQAYKILAELEILEDNPQEALQLLDYTFKNNIALDYSMRKNHVLKAEALRHLEQYDRAIEEIDLAIKESKSKASEFTASNYFLSTLYRQKSDLYVLKNDYSSASKILREAESIHRSSYQTSSQEMSRFIIKWKTESARKAIDSIKEDIEKNLARMEMEEAEYAAFFPQIFMERALIYESIGEKDRAARDYRLITSKSLEELKNRKFNVFPKSDNSVSEFLNFVYGLQLPPENINTPEREKEQGNLALIHAFAYDRLGDSKKSSECLAEALKFGIDKNDLMKDFRKKADLELKW